MPKINRLLMPLVTSVFFIFSSVSYAKDFPAEWGSCVSDSNCVPFIDFSVCQLIGINKGYEKQANEFVNARGPLVEMTCFDMVCRDEWLLVQPSTTSRCLKGKCHVSLDNKAYARNVKILNDDRMRKHRRKHGLK